METQSAITGVAIPRSETEFINDPSQITKQIAQEGIEYLLEVGIRLVDVDGLHPSASYAINEAISAISAFEDRIRKINTQYNSNHIYSDLVYALDCLARGILHTPNAQILNNQIFYNLTQTSLKLSALPLRMAR
ncbi:hypothetical protein H6503_05165 [Candidatus Woesearchaeota archaeon]|nr:hypothetical protein [Candidatus Woesearchaeota archaeon]